MIYPLLKVKYWHPPIVLTLTLSPIATLLPFPSVLSVFASYIWLLWCWMHIQSSLSIHALLHIPKSMDAQDLYIKWHSTMNTDHSSYPQISHLQMEPTVHINFNAWLGWLNPWVQARRAHDMFIERNPCVSGPMWFKPVLQESNVYLNLLYLPGELTFLSSCNVFLCLLWQFLS